MALTYCAREGCDNKLEGNRRKWCSDNCRKIEDIRLRRLASKPATKGQRGRAYERATSHENFQAVLDGKYSQARFARELGMAEGTVSKAIVQWREDHKRDLISAGWRMDDDMARMLHVDPQTRLPAEIPDDPDSPEGQAFLDHMVEMFVEFSDAVFEAKGGQNYIFRPFHRSWVRLIMKAYFYGLKATILSPPRHGKSELLVRFSVWVIARDRDVQILWVSKAEDVGKNMLGMVRRNLEHNQTLLARCIPPNEQYAPRKRGENPWTDTEFSVGGRSLSAKSPTMRLATRGGTILSLDTDFIVTDDIEDFKSTSQAHLRTKTRIWFGSDVDSRKVEHTGWLNIGSRQNFDDLHGHLLEDPTWEHIVDTAHDPACELDPNDMKAHVDCMLFPEMRSYKWLMSKKASADSQGHPELFEMIYLNSPRPEGQILFSKENVEAAYDRSRGLGLRGLPEDLQLVAGLDPAPVNYQAGFLWGVSLFTKTAYMIDLDNRRGAGIDGFLHLGQQWNADYGLKHWVVESTGWMRGYRTEERIRTWAALSQIVIEGHHTGMNKHDPLYGVGSMAMWFDPESEFRISLPYGTEAAREKVDLYTRQLLGFSAESGKQKRPTDTVMASWFPTFVIRRMIAEQQSTMKVTYTPSHAGLAQTGLNAAPW